MNDYTFDTLNDKEFENLTVDLLSQEFQINIERFKSGRDGGIDGRFFQGDIESGTVIIQCKHWLKSGISPLLTECRNKEFDKVKKLNPSRYIFVTSLELSAKNKKDIFDIFEPYIKSESDIVGKEDLNSLLGKHADVERRHYKLWLSSTNVLQSILSNDVLGRSDFYFEEIKAAIPKYVRTENHENALNKLEELGSIIINGEPGIGKTTLAEQLCFDYSAQGFQLVVIHESITEAESLYTPESRQVFYFDDFLGSNFLSAMDSKQDSHVISFIKRINKDKNKRFILTTRSNILNQGKRLSERFEQNNIDRNEYEIKIGSLTDWDKAQILYNHIFFSALTESFIEQIHIDNRYKTIVLHKNFNPRLISFITDFAKVEKIVTPDAYWKYIQELLDNPKDVWRGMVANQISDLDRHIIIATTLNGNAINEAEIPLLLTRLKEEGLDTTNDYPSVDNIMRGLVGSVLNRNIPNSEQVSYSLFNPSIADFIISEYFCRVDYLAKLISCLRTVKALRNIEKLANSDKVSLSYETLLVSLLQIELGSNLSPDLYTFQLIEMSETIQYDSKPVVKKIIDYFPDSLFESFGMNSIKLSILCIEQGLFKTDNLYLKSIVIKSLEDSDFNYFKDIANLISLLDGKSELIELFKKEVVYCISEVITDWAVDESKFQDLYDDLHIDIEDINIYVESLLCELGCRFDFNEAELEDMAYSLDMGRVIANNNEREYYNDRGIEEYNERRNSYDGFSPIMDSIIDPIDDLFDRG